MFEEKTKTKFSTTKKELSFLEFFLNNRFFRICLFTSKILKVYIFNVLKGELLFCLNVKTEEMYFLFAVMEESIFIHFVFIRI